LAITIDLPVMPMVQIPSSGKRRAEPVMPATVETEMEGLGCGHGAPNKRLKTPPPPAQARRSDFFFLASL
jgi:hypothetical protein